MLNPDWFSLQSSSNFSSGFPVIRQTFLPFIARHSQFASVLPKIEKNNLKAIRLIDVGITIGLLVLFMIIFSNKQGKRLPNPPFNGLSPGTQLN